MDIPIESHSPNKNKRKLILFPLPLQGHINPMLQLATILHARGCFSITIIHTNFNSPTSVPSNLYPHDHFTFHPIIPQGISTSEINGWFSRDLTAPLIHLNSACASPFREALAELVSSSPGDVEEEEGEKESSTIGCCLITDAAWYFTQEVADGFGIPRIVLRTSNVSTFVVYDAFPLLRDQGYLPIRETQLEEPVRGFSPLRVKDLPEMKPIENPEDYYYLISKMLASTRASSGLVYNSCLHLEQDAINKCNQIFPGVPIFHIGPFHKHFQAHSTSNSLFEADQSSISWLDTQEPKSVLYVSFGSLAAISQAHFSEIAWALANSKRPFLWVVRPGSVHGSDWLGPLPEGWFEFDRVTGQIVKWALQEKVLAHPAIGGFWTHCGWNSVLESTSEGVPMICHPSFADQKINARYVCDVWQVGMHLEGKIEREGIEKVIRRLMVEREGEEIRERVMSLKGKLDASLKQGGSSYQSLDSLVSYILSF